MHRINEDYNQGESECVLNNSYRSIENDGSLGN